MIPNTNPRIDKTKPPANIPSPKIEPIQKYCAAVAAAPYKVQMAVPVEAVPKTEIDPRTADANVKPPSFPKASFVAMRIRLFEL